MNKDEMKLIDIIRNSKDPARTLELAFELIIQQLQEQREEERRNAANA